MTSKSVTKSKIRSQERKSIKTACDECAPVRRRRIAYEKKRRGRLLRRSKKDEIGQPKKKNRVKVLGKMDPWLVQGSALRQITGTWSLVRSDRAVKEQRI
jgi:hypothetical protein